jgi:integrase
MGLGSLASVSLAEARHRAADARRQLAAGRDPLEERNTTRTAAKSCSITFADTAARYIDAHADGWRSPRHINEWRTTLAAYAKPVLGNMPVAAIDTSSVLQVLQPLWRTKVQTASRLRGRIEAVLAYAAAQGWRDALNPAMWRGHLQLLLPSPRKVRTVVHHPALDWREAPEFMRDLRECNSLAARALEFTILTATRSGEARGATWAEIDMEAALWTIPAARMKAQRSHRVPLSEPALALLQLLRPLRTDGGCLFPGRDPREPFTDGALIQVLHRMDRSDLTVHGFRSTFRDWAAETTHHQNHVVEQALAHTIGSAVEAAYRRGDLFDKRRALMDEWAAFLDYPATNGKIARLRGRVAAA